jgi:hypothetical protein
LTRCGGRRRFAGRRVVGVGNTGSTDGRPGDTAHTVRLDANQKAGADQIVDAALNSDIQLGYVCCRRGKQRRRPECRRSALA